MPCQENGSFAKVNTVRVMNRLGELVSPCSLHLYQMLCFFLSLIALGIGSLSKFAFVLLAPVGLFISPSTASWVVLDFILELSRARISA